MASKRQLKKSINYIAGVAAGNSIVLTLGRKDIPSEEIAMLSTKAMILRREALNRINHVEPGNTKLFFKKVTEDFNQGIESIYDRLEELLQK